jgi:hypothetical protein
MFFVQEGFTYIEISYWTPSRYSSLPRGSGCSSLLLPICSDATLSPAGARRVG